MRKAEFKAVHPVLPVRNVGDAIEYYTGKLGFKSVFVDSTKVPRYAGVIRDRVELHLQWHDEADFASVEKPSLRFFVDGVDELFEEYKPKEVFHSQTALRDTPWGTREFAFFDPDNNGLTFYRDL